MKFRITLTWSKIVAVLVIGLAFVIDLMNATPGTVFMFSLPFSVALILGKQGKELLSELKKK